MRLMKRRHMAAAIGALAWSLACCYVTRPRRLPWIKFGVWDLARINGRVWARIRIWGLRTPFVWRLP